MRVTIIVDGRERNFVYDYDRLHNAEWNGVIRDMLDAAHDAETAAEEDKSIF